MSKPLKEEPIKALLSRPITEDYIQQWMEILKNAGNKKEDPSFSIFIFRLGVEWLALSTHCLKEVIFFRSIHHLPRQRNEYLLGVVNLNGELQPCVSLHKMLHIENASEGSKKRFYQKNRMIAIAKEQDVWVFPVDEIEGIQQYKISAIENVPVNVIKSSANYSKGIITTQERVIGLLDEELLFYSFKRKIS